MSRIYEPNPKHKRGASGEGPPRWFPSRDTPCPDDLDLQTAQELLKSAKEGANEELPDRRALFALHAGEFYKAYRHGVRQNSDGTEDEIWHGFPVRNENVPRQVPSRVLLHFVQEGRLTRAEYKKLLGSAR